MYNAVPDQLQQLRQPYQQPAQAQQRMPVNQDERIWVASQAAAEAYIVAPNGFVRLWDSNNPVFYERRCDATGKPYPTVAYEYKVRNTTPQEAPQAVVQAVNNTEYDNKIKALEERIQALENVQCASSGKE
jgi:hypothetical protein